MKNFRKVASILLAFVVVLVSNVSVFAALTGGADYTMELKASKNEVKVGEEVTIGIYLSQTSGASIALDQNSMNSAQFSFDTKGFSVADNGLVKSDDAATFTANNGTVTWTLKTTATTISKDTAFASVKFVANAVGTYKFELEGVDGTCSIGGLDFYFASEDGGTDDYGLVADAISVTVTAGGSTGSTDIVVEDETFDDANEGKLVEADVANKNVVVGDESIAMGESGKVYTFFKKNDTQNDLQSLKYGLKVTIGDKTYKFPGQAPVPAGKAWAIKLVVPNGTFEDSVSVGTMSAADVYFVD